MNLWTYVKCIFKFLTNFESRKFLTFSLSSFTLCSQISNSRSKLLIADGCHFQTSGFVRVCSGSFVLLACFANIGNKYCFAFSKLQVGSMGLFAMLCYWGSSLLSSSHQACFLQDRSAAFLLWFILRCVSARRACMFRVGVSDRIVAALFRERLW